MKTVSENAIEIVDRLLSTFDKEDDPIASVEAALMHVVIIAMRCGATEDQKEFALKAFNNVLKTNWDVAFTAKKIMNSTGVGNA
jgi:hypothetical protein